jgi:hypothetical protein
LAKRTAVGAYRLQYLDRSHKFIRQDVVNATTDEEAVALAKNWRLRRRFELWADGRLVAKFSRDGPGDKLDTARGHSGNGSFGSKADLTS